MVLNYVALIIIIIVLALIIAFLYVKDKDMNQTIVYLQDAIEELNSNSSTTTTESEGISKDSQAYKELDAKIYEVGESLIKIVRSIKNLDKKVESLELKVKQIEEAFKLSMISSSANSNDLDIIAMYKNGKSPEEIAKEKRVPIGEVELIIKLANLNDDE